MHADCQRLLLVDANVWGLQSFLGIKAMIHERESYKISSPVPTGGVSILFICWVDKISSRGYV